MKALGRLQLDSEIISLEPGKHCGFVIPTHTHTHTHTPHPTRALGRVSESGVWSGYETVITTYFSKAIYTDYWSQRGERQKKHFVSLCVRVSLSLFSTIKEL